jgi:hypothetical protein
MDDEKVFVVGIVENPRKVIEMLRKKPIGSDYSRTSAYKMDVQLVYCGMHVYKIVSTNGHY